MTVSTPQSTTDIGMDTRWPSRHFPDLWAAMARSDLLSPRPDGRKAPASVLVVGNRTGAYRWFSRHTDLQTYVVDADAELESPDSHQLAWTPKEGPNGVVMWRRFDLAYLDGYLDRVAERDLPQLGRLLDRCSDVYLCPEDVGRAGDPSYWIGVMAAFGKALEMDATHEARVLAATNLAPRNSFAQRGLVFRSA